MAEVSLHKRKAPSGSSSDHPECTEKPQKRQWPGIRNRTWSKQPLLISVSRSECFAHDLVAGSFRCVDDIQQTRRSADKLNAQDSQHSTFVHGCGVPTWKVKAKTQARINLEHDLKATIYQRILVWKSSLLEVSHTKSCNKPLNGESDKRWDWTLLVYLVRTSLFFNNVPLLFCAFASLLQVALSLLCYTCVVETVAPRL